MNGEFFGQESSAPAGYEADALRGFSRTIAEIQWLLVILVLLYQIAQGREDESTAAVYLGLTGYCISVLVFRYVGLLRHESRWKLAVETWVMIAFITWVLYHTGGIESPLLNLYLLTIVVSALTLGVLSTLLEVALIAACYIFLWNSSSMGSAVAHVGVAMGARGADVALEQAEIVLMHDRLENFLAAFRLSQNARKVIRQNLVVSLGTVAVLVGFALFGKIPLTVGVLGHEGSTVVVVLNSLRLLFMKSQQSPLETNRQKDE